MDKFVEFTKKYCLKELAVITLVSLVLFFIFYGKQDVYLIDVGREVYVPWQMLKGQVLYKDIFNVYGPLGYQINTLAYALLGVKLNTLFVVGFFSSLIICFSSFFIAKLFTDRKTSLCITGLTLFVCVYAKGFFNFIFTYSYNAVFALLGFLLSLYFALRFFKDKKSTHLFCSFLFAGFSFANKIEYVPYFIFLFLCLPFFIKRMHQTASFTEDVHTIQDCTSDAEFASEQMSLSKTFYFSLKKSLKAVFDRANSSDLFAALKSAVKNLTCILNRCKDSLKSVDYSQYCKAYFQSFIAFMIFPLISFGILFIQGVSVSDLLQSAVYIKKLMQAPVTNYFYYTFGLYFNTFQIKSNCVYLGQSFKMIMLFSFVMFVLNLSVVKFVKKTFLKIIANFAMFFMLVYFTLFKFYSIFGSDDYIYYNFFAFLGIFLVIMLAVAFVIGIFKMHGISAYIRSLSLKSKMLIFLSVSAILVSLKGFFDISIGCYGTFILAAMFIPFVVFVVEFIPELFKFLNKKAWKKTVRNACFLIMILYFLGGITKISIGNYYKISQPRGNLYIREFYPKQNQLISYIRKNTPKDAVILTVPEGAIINFLAERDSLNMFYYLIPVNIQIFGEDYVLKELKKRPPDYFVLSNILYSVYGVGDFCSFAPSICDYINNNYELEVFISGQVDFYLYKRK